MRSPSVAASGWPATRASSCSRARSRSGSGRTAAGTATREPAWGLHEYAGTTSAAWAETAAQRAAELFLEHRVYRSLATGETISPEWIALHYPPYWHYDVLQALLVLGRLGRLEDERASDALDLLVRLRRPDGRWEPGGCWWRKPGSRTQTEVVDWVRHGPNEMITLNALRVLRTARRELAGSPTGGG